MSLIYNPLVVSGKYAESILGELFFQNKTIAENLVSFESNVKAQTVFTEFVNTSVIQAYVSGAPTSSGSTSLEDITITPAKLMSYIEFSPETLRPSRFNKALAAGAWAIDNNEFARTVLASFGEQISSDLEYQFYNGVLASTQSTVAASATGSTMATTQERALIAGSVAGQFDGVVAKLVLKHARSIVTGTTVTSSNIAAEIGKVYAAINPLVLDSAKLFVPYGFRQLINIANSSATYRDLFSKEGEKYFYNGIEIVFIPLAGSTMIAAKPEDIFWCTDLNSDFSYVEINKVQNNADTMYVKAVMTLDSHIAKQKYVTLYV